MCACVYGYMCESGSVYANVHVWQFVGGAIYGSVCVSVCVILRETASECRRVILRG